MSFEDAVTDKLIVVDREDANKALYDKKDNFIVSFRIV
jgi:hypothetical protein